MRRDNDKIQLFYYFKKCILPAVLTAVKHLTGHFGSKAPVATTSIFSLYRFNRPSIFLLHPPAHVLKLHDIHHRTNGPVLKQNKRIRR